MDAIREMFRVRFQRGKKIDDRHAFFLRDLSNQSLLFFESRLINAKIRLVHRDGQAHPDAGLRPEAREVIDQGTQIICKGRTSSAA